MPIAVHFTTDTPAAVAGADHLVFCGPKAALARADVVALVPDALRPMWSAVLDSLTPGDAVAATNAWVPRPSGSPLRVAIVAISDRASRHNAPGRPDLVATALKGRVGKTATTIVLALERTDDALAVGAAAARAFPLYSRKKRGDDGGPLSVALATPGVVADATRARLAALARAIREAQRLVDMPASELHTDAFVAEAEAVARATGATIRVLRMAELRDKGMGGLASVGQAAIHGPALVHLRHDPPSPELGPVAWVGKGIVYDTGGLSLKPKGDMPGMKNDMGGAAAVLHAFQAAVELGLPRRIDAILCLAENSVGPLALRPDDILTLYSGKSVEVNNTDAEGRLVLADGVAFAGKDCQSPLVVDLATLTGAQLVATGKLHAGVVTNDELLEAACIQAGRRSGDLCFALPYAPELFRHEFASPVADLRNSVKDRMNAQSSCAAQFIAESLDPNVRWLHIDMAGPVTSRDRGTGFGVALLVELFSGGHGV